MTACEKMYGSLAKSLLDDIVNATEPSAERAVDILAALQKESNRKPMTVSILKNTKIGKYLTKTAKSCKWHKGRSTSDDKDEWDEALKTAEALLSDFKDVATPSKKKNAVKKDGASKKSLTNGSNSRYNSRSSAAASSTATTSSKVNCSADARRKAAKLGLEKRRKEKAVAVSTAETKQPSSASTKISPKRENTKNPKDGNSINSTKDNKAKQSSLSPALKIKSKKTNNTKNSQSGAKRSLGSKRKSTEEDAASNANVVSNSNIANGGDDSIKKSKAERSSPEYPSKRNAAEKSDASKTIHSDTVDGGESAERRNKGISNSSISSSDGRPRDDAPIRRVSPPPSLYKVCQRVFAKDDATGLLYPAFIRKVMWGPTQSQISQGFCSALVDGESIGGKDDHSNKTAEDDDEDEDARRWDPKQNCYHCFVHYMGWNVKWDRWVEETYLYEDSASTTALAKLLTREYNKVKPKKRGQKMTVAQVRKWMDRMLELEAEHVRSVKEGKLGGEQDESGKGDMEGEEEDAKMSETGLASGKKEESNKTANEPLSDSPATREEEEEEGERIDKTKKNKPIKKINEETLRKQAQLREGGLQMKRKRTVSERLTLPFNLKTVLVQEWEVITQCNMVHKLPSEVSVREALNRYLENKLAPLREKQEEENIYGDKMATDGVGSDKMQSDESLSKHKNTKCSVLGKEWIDMVENIALFFDQCLPIHLLFEEERSQYKSLRRQIIAQSRNSAARASSMATDDGSKTAIQGKKLVENLVDSIREKHPFNIQSGTTANASIVTASESSVSSANLKSPPPKFLPGRMSEIYGCEHLLRLFVRLPAVVAASPTITEMESRRIFSKLGDLVRYLQKHQSQLFCSSFRRPLAGESRGIGGGGGSKKVGGK